MLTTQGNTSRYLSLSVTINWSFRLASSATPATFAIRSKNSRYSTTKMYLTASWLSHPLVIATYIYSHGSQWVIFILGVIDESLKRARTGATWRRPLHPKRPLLVTHQMPFWLSDISFVLPALSTSPRCLRMTPTIAFLRLFGINTTWYLPFHRI